MSVDEFDPFIERAFDRAPPMPDTALFVADLEARLQSGARFRAVGLGVAGAIGGVVALREMLTLDMDLGGAEALPGVDAAQAAGQSVNLDVASALQAAMERWGVADLALGGLGSMQMFWIAAAAVAALALAGVVRLSQDV
ncbi:MAG: hypothetical protein KKF88_02200 [Alphaproteobacteria bacterium]|nr:hypothetical protein [Alphaproteobacteria bacterium]